MRSFRPQISNMLDILLWMHKFNILISDNTIDSADKLYPWMGSIEFLLKQLHYEFNSLWFLWMFSFTFMLSHPRIINEPSLAYIHLNINLIIRKD